MPSHTILFFIPSLPVFPGIVDLHRYTCSDPAPEDTVINSLTPTSCDPLTLLFTEKSSSAAAVDPRKQYSVTSHRQGMFSTYGHLKGKGQKQNKTKQKPKTNRWHLTRTVKHHFLCWEVLVSHRWFPLRYMDLGYFLSPDMTRSVFLEF